MSNIRRKKVINKMVGNGRSMGRAMREAGYSKAYSDHPEKLKRTKKFKKEIKPILKRLKEERDAALKEMKNKRGVAKYGELNNAVENLSKLVELLEGRETGRAKVILTDL